MFTPYRLQVPWGLLTLRVGRVPAGETPTSVYERTYTCANGVDVNGGLDGKPSVDPRKRGIWGPEDLRLSGPPHPHSIG